MTPLDLSIRGLGVVGGFGCGTAALETALAGTLPTPGQVAFHNDGREVVLPAFRADTARLEDFLPKRALRRIDHYSRLALLGASLALADAGREGLEPERIGVVVASGYGATRTTFAFLDSVIDDGDQCASPTHFSNSVHNAAAAHISILLGITGPSLTVSQFEMSVPSALLSAARWLEEGRVDAVLFGGVDEYCDVLGYCWEHFFGSGDGGPIRPLELHRQSAILAEGAAFFVLTRNEGAPSRYGTVNGICFGRQNGRPLPIPADALLLLGVDGHRRCGGLYPRQIPEEAAVVSYSPLYGSLPVGPAFDMAIAALIRAGGTIYPAPGEEAGTWGNCPGRVIRRPGAIGSRPVACLKCSGSGEVGIITLGPST
jgi:3-oxoacyl-[acyl-carrier-protein] synthase II